MKTKLLALLMALVMIVTCLASCGGGDNPGTNPGGGGSNPGGGGGEEEEVYYDWDETTLRVEMTDNSNNEELSSGCKRYLAGPEYSKCDDPLDDKIDVRNQAAYDKTKVKVLYDFKPDSALYNWGQNMTRIYNQVYSYNDEAPDIYCNFVYDMVACSLEKCFANLYSTVRGEGSLYGANYFEFANEDYEDKGTGYMYEYMTTLTLSKSKMYCLSSDYYTDMVRAFFVVPVNIAALNSIQPAPEGVKGEFNSDRAGEKGFNIEDFYQLVWDGDWTYETLAAFAGAYGADADTEDAIDLRDRICFAISTASGLSASGMLYTTSITIINRDPNASAYNNYNYSYPEPDSEDANALYDYCNKLNTLFKTPYIITVANDELYGKGADSLQAIRNRFADDENPILFGGVICVGSLEYEEYQKLNAPEKEGFGVVPVPVYQKGDSYLTQIHNIGRIGAISANTTKFAQCSAFLNYQSLNSTKILNDYYTVNLQYDVAGGSEDNIDMLNYIREHVRSSFDKAFEDAIGKFFQVTDTDSNEDKWHIMLMRAKFQMTNMADAYKGVFGKKADKLRLLEEEYEGLPD